MNKIMKLISVLATLIVLCVCLCESGIINISIETADSYNTVGFSPHNCSRGNDNDYVFFNKKEVNWFKAQQLCQNSGMKLASITNAEDNEKLHKIILENLPNSERYIWLSGAKTEENDDFTWMRTGEILLYSNWAPKYPSAISDALCMCMGRDALWYNCLCRNRYYFICQRDCYAKLRLV